MSKRYDAIIIGTGPAGLEAAITMKIRNKDFLLIGNGVSTKVEKAHEISNYLGLPAVKGADLGQAFENHLKQMEIEITEDSITAIYSMGDYFSLTSKSNDMYEAESVILATGVSFGKPYPGEEKYLGRGVSYCATCDAPLYKGKTVAIIGGAPSEESEAIFMREVAGKVYYIPLYNEEIDESRMEGIEILRDSVQEIAGDKKADTLVLKNQKLEVDGVFILRESISPAQLVPGLKMDGNHIAVTRQMETNLNGCFACGDITGTPYQYIKAAGEGNVAALAAVAYLDKKHRDSK